MHPSRRNSTTHRKRGAHRNGTSSSVGAHRATWRFQPAWATFASDFALAGIMFFAPLIMGGRQPLGKLVYLSLVALLTASYLAERAFGQIDSRWKKTGIEWLLLGGLGVLVVQLIHWPPELLARLSPFQGELLPQWSGGLAGVMGQSPWDQISLTPHATWQAMGVYVAHALLFLVLVQRFQSADKLERWLQWAAIASLAMASLGLLQFISGTDRYVWMFEHESRPANLEVCGPYANSNHYTHFLALGIGPLVWWLQRFNRTVVAGPTGNTFRGQKSTNQWFAAAAALALAIVAMAGLLAESRGGILVMFLATVTAVGLFVRLKLLSSRSWFALGGIGLIVLCGLAFYGYQSVHDELSTIASGSLDSIDQEGARRKIWMANLDVARHFPLFGAGVGSHLEIYPRFFPHFSTIQYTHAESSWLQILSESGVVGLGLVVLGVIYCGRWCWSALRHGDIRRKGHAVAVTAGVLASVTHAVFDFPWHIPSCMAFGVMLAAAAFALSDSRSRSIADDTREPSSKLVHGQRRSGNGVPWLPAAGLIALLMFVHAFVGPAIGDAHWTKYRQIARDSKRNLRQWLTAQSSPSDRERKLSRSLYEDSRRMVAHLDRVLQHDPYHPRAHWRITEQYIRLFEFAQRNSDNAMGLAQIRDAATVSKFDSREELDQWMDRAIGEPKNLLHHALHHARVAMRICPLQGRVYLYASDLAFLQGVRRDGSLSLIQMASRVNPHDAAVLFTIGRESVLNGNFQEALTYWRKSFHLSHEYREAIITSVAGQMPAEMFLTVFEPDEHAMESLMRFYRSQNLIQPARIVAPFVVEQLVAEADQKSGISSAKLWHRCREIHRFLDDTELALEASRHAVAAAPNWLEGRVALAEELLVANFLEESLLEYRWCLRRRPHDARLRNQAHNLESMIARREPNSVQTAAGAQSPNTRW